MKKTKPMKNRRGTNQYKSKKRMDAGWGVTLFIYVMIVMVGLYDLNLILTRPSEASEIVKTKNSPVAPMKSQRLEASTSAALTPTPTPSKTEEIVAYIVRVFEPEGKEVVRRAINCFYSESGWREEAVGHNKDAAKSTDHGVAQLNSYWHKLTEEEKTNYKANIDRAYKIYKGRGNNFSAWYGKLCN